MRLKFKYNTAYEKPHITLLYTLMLMDQGFMNAKVQSLIDIMLISKQVSYLFIMVHKSIQ